MHSTSNFLFDLKRVSNAYMWLASNESLQVKSNVYRRACNIKKLSNATEWQVSYKQKITNWLSRDFLPWPSHNRLVYATSAKNTRIYSLPWLRRLRSSCLYRPARVFKMCTSSWCHESCHFESPHPMHAVTNWMSKNRNFTTFVCQFLATYSGIEPQRKLESVGGDSRPVCVDNGPMKTNLQ